jgi:hypothetical protein
MSKIVSLVIAVNTDTGLIEFDGDGSREWIRRLFEVETNTYDTELQEWVKAPIDEKIALNLLMTLGVAVDGLDYDNWMER